MKFIIVFAALFAVALARPQQDAQIVRYDNDNIGVDGFKYAYETSNGISSQESGSLKPLGPEGDAIVVTGSYSYTSPEGEVITVNYVADENGFQPVGAHLPVA